MAGRSFCSRCGPPASFSLVCIRTLYLTIALEAHKLPSSDLRTSATTTEGVGASSTKGRGSTASARLAVTGTWRSVSSVPAATARPERDLGDLTIPGAPLPVGACRGALRLGPGRDCKHDPRATGSIGGLRWPGRNLAGPRLVRDLPGNCATGRSPIGVLPVQPNKVLPGVVLYQRQARYCELAAEAAVRRVPCAAA